MSDDYSTDCGSESDTPVDSSPETADTPCDSGEDTCDTSCDDCDTADDGSEDLPEVSENDDSESAVGEFDAKSDIDGTDTEAVGDISDDANNCDVDSNTTPEATDSQSEEVESASEEATEIEPQGSAFDSSKEDTNDGFDETESHDAYADTTESDNDTTIDGNSEDDKQFGIVSVGANGSYSIQVKDGKKFLMKLVGNNVPFFTDVEINKYFRTAFMSKIKVYIAKFLKQENLSVLDLLTEYENIAEKMIPQLDEVLDEYGVRLVNFYIGGINIPETDPSYMRIQDAVSRMRRMDVYGDQYGRLTGEMLLENMSASPAAGGAAGAGMGMGMGMMAGGMMGGIASQVFAPVGQAMQQGVQQPIQRGGGSRYAPQETNIGGSSVKCPVCGEDNPASSKLCNSCGAKMETKCFCNNCGAELAPGVKFCGNCGTRRD